MRIKDITSRLHSRRKGLLGEVSRFACVGIVAVLLQYVVYWLLIKLFADNALIAGTHFYSSMAMTMGYIVSFAFNFVASVCYTFKVKASAKKSAGFALAHAVNWGLQILMLNLFLWAGLSKQLAPIPMFCVCVPVNFLLVRFFLRDKK